jgi:hypothetical protein
MIDSLDAVSTNGIEYLLWLGAIQDLAVPIHRMRPYAALADIGGNNMPGTVPLPQGWDEFRADLT